MDISTFDIVTFISIVGGIASIIGCICSEAKDRINYPGLLLRHRCFRRCRIKAKDYHIVIIKNGDAQYTKNIANAFKNRAGVIFEKTEYALIFHEYEGNPFIDGDSQNKELMLEIVERYQEATTIVVTIGTQISISAKKYLLNIFPIIAVGVANPESFDHEKDDNIAIVRYNIGLRRRIEFLRNLFVNNKKIKFVFIYNEKVSQDSLMAQDVKRISNEINDIVIEIYSIAGRDFPQELDKSNIVCFGFYHLDHYLIDFLKQAKKAVFIGLSQRDTMVGAIASTENDDYRLGEISVEKILVPKIIKRKHLSGISLINPDPYFTINTKMAEDRNFKFTRKAIRKAIKNIDFYNFI